MKTKHLVERHALVTGCNVNDLAMAVESYHAAKAERRNGKRYAHSIVEARHGRDYADWAQDLVEDFGA